MAFDEIDRLLELDEWWTVWIAETRLIATSIVELRVSTVVLLLADIVHHAKAYCRYLVKECQLLLWREGTQSIDHPMIHEVWCRGFDNVPASGSTFKYE